MSNSQKEKCHHTKISPFFSATSHYTFCLHCGAIIIKEDTTNNLKYFIKPLNQQKLSSTNPIEIALLMKSKTNLLPNKDNSISNWYSQNRKKILMYLQRLTISMHYSDSTFYTTLFFLDKVLRNKESEDDIIIKNIDSFVIAFYLIIAKMNETNLQELDLDQFPSLTSGNFLQSKDIINFEQYILNYMNYDIIDFSAYDWLNVFLNNGIVFEDEIQSMPSNTINVIYSYTKKTIASITNTDVFLLYSPFQIAFSIIRIARGQYDYLPNSTLEILHDIYQIKESDYLPAYLAINEVLEKKKKKTKMKESAPTVLQSTFHSPNSDSVKIINNYQLESNHIIGKRIKHSQNDVSKCNYNALNQKAYNVTSTSISTNISEEKSTTSIKSLNINLFMKEEEENKRKKGKQFKTVKMTQKINFEDINKVNKMKNDFVNSVEHYEYCNTVGNEKMKHKSYASFIVGSANKIKLNNVRYKLSGSIIADAQKNSNVKTLQNKFQLIVK